MATTTTITTESDMHGEDCPWCSDTPRPCVTNIYLTTEHGDDLIHTCVECITTATQWRHCGDTDPHVEISTAPLPQELAAPTGVAA